jgi:cell division protein FtsQ
MTGNKRKQKGLSFGMTVFLLLVIIAIVYVISMVFFRVEKIEVAGNQRYTADELRSTSGIQYNDRLFGVGTYRVGRRLSEQLPYLHEVRVRALIPNTVVINVVEAQPLAYIRQDNYYWILDRYGKILEKAVYPHTAALTELHGVVLESPDVNRHMISTFEHLQKNAYAALVHEFIERDMMSDVSQIDFANLTEVTFKYKENFDVRIGTVEELDYKLTFLSAKITELTADKPAVKGFIDLSTAVETRSARFIEDIG